MRQIKDIQGMESDQNWLVLHGGGGASDFLDFCGHHK